MANPSPSNWGIGDLSPTGVPHFVGIIRDISERKRIERDIRDSEQRFRDFAESSSDWFWETGEDMRFTRFSGNFTEHTRILPDHYVGHTRDEMIGDATDPEVRRQALALASELLERGAPAQISAVPRGSAHL